MYSSVALSHLVVAEDNETEALFLLVDMMSSGSAEDIEAAEKLYTDAKNITDIARAAWESFLPKSLR